MRIILGVVLLTLLHANVLAQFNYRITVKDVETGQALPGANIVFNNQISVTDNDGNAQFESLSKGTYPIKVTFVGYDDLAMNVKINESRTDVLELIPGTLMTDEVIVSSTRASAETPVTFSSLNKEKIEKQNSGQDLPFILNFTPSVVSTSDAGAGIGYTGLRIRGSDATRVNVTINGVPLNDSESQGVFWVNIPDIASSTNNIQIQRGVGTSTNGAGAFGGSINLQTNGRETAAHGVVTNTFGSYNTRRHSIGFGTGLLNNLWTIDGRISKIKSDGYIDRASSDLTSYYFAGGYYGKKTMLKALVFGGAEVTYQSWYGTPEAVLENDAEGIEAVIANNGLNAAQAQNMRNSGRTFNWYLYDNEVDDYKQDHYQLHLSHQVNDKFSFNVSTHYTYGRGFYEQYRYDDDFEDYGLDNVIVGADTVFSTDLIRKRWLDNDFYGVTYSFNYEEGPLKLIFGGAANRYDGDHFGELIWADFAFSFDAGDRYYESNGVKDDFNSYIKAYYQISDPLNVFLDLQYRKIGYKSQGVDSDLQPIDINADFDFFNPKLGAFYQLSGNDALYASFAVGNREPVRSDFIDSNVKPKAERLNNLELGYRMTNSNKSIGVNFYYMGYKDQLILTGEVNDVGSSVRTNVPASYRAGLEFEGGVKLSDNLNWSANLTLSRNKIEKFTEIIYDYGPAFDEYNIISNEYSDTDIAFSPNVIAGSQLAYSPFRNFEVALLSKYVGKQYLDNTSNEKRKIDAYFVNDIRLDYSIYSEKLRELRFSLLINNILDEEYVSNGYTFGYQGGPDYVVRENYYYPQAPTNFLATVTLKF
ncbi:TonB-dependent receptor [Fulvivirga lutimaris]|uniref:TonB-dependent receptor n=1 Tax=Fulvivirga lutimaris TaxID=1819566 RepID=UPI0012BCB931|nr:TonB-dependent receptor [Fulvivirga lutimaris]MTI41525.1 TonB-dependent receptor [Fulvivirga lutimaris]